MFLLLLALSPLAVAQYPVPVGNTQSSPQKAQSLQQLLASQYQYQQQQQQPRLAPVLCQRNGYPFPPPYNSNGYLNQQTLPSRDNYLPTNNNIARPTLSPITGLTTRNYQSFQTSTSVPMQLTTTSFTTTTDPFYLRNKFISNEKLINTLTGAGDMYAVLTDIFRPSELKEMTLNGI